MVVRQNRKTKEIPGSQDFAFQGLNLKYPKDLLLGLTLKDPTITHHSTILKMEAFWGTT